MSSEEKKQGGITRREFIGTAAGAAGGLVVGAVGATLLAGQKAAPAVAPATAPAAAQASGLPQKWDRVTDVLVVGTGYGGLPAAIEAKRAGADVLIIDRNDHVGGLSRMAGGSFSMGGGNIIQIRDGVTDDTLEKWYQDELYAHEYRCVPEIMRNLVQRGGETVKWFQDLGIVYDTIAAGVLRPPIKRGLTAKQSPNYVGGVGTPNTGVSFVQVMHKELEKLGVPILLKHRMKSIYRDPNGDLVHGVKVDTPQGTINIHARKAVVLATGTWTDNYRMAQAWDPRIVGPDCYGDGGTPTDGTLVADSAGDGHLAAAEIGAGFADMSYVSYIYIFFGSRSYFAWNSSNWAYDKDVHAVAYAAGKGLPQDANFFQRVILVKGDGTRYLNEMAGTWSPPPGRSGRTEWPESEYTATYLSLPQPRNVWMVADSDAATALKWPLDEIKNPKPKVGLTFDAACLAIADTLASLAGKMGIPAAALEATVTKYNGFVDAGKDADFGKPMPLYKIAKPPFYGAKASLIRHTQRNGIRVNTKSQVIDQSDQMDGYAGRGTPTSVSIDSEKVIPHLYAAGELGNVLGWRRTHNSIGHYVTASRIAGENAAKETPCEV